MTIVIRTYDRCELLALTLWSVAKSYLPFGARVEVSADGPPSPAVEELICEARKWLNHADARLRLWHGDTRLGVQGHARWTAQNVPLDERPYFCNLTDDCYVSPSWLLVLEHLQRKVGGERLGVLSGYNAGWSDTHNEQAGIPPHTIRRGHAPVLGLIHAGMYRRAMHDFEPGVTKDDQGNPSAWDNLLWAVCDEHNKLILSTERSVINHLGVRGLHGTDNPPAADFVGW